MCTFRIGRRHLRIYRCKVASENDRRSEVESGGGGKEGGSSGKESLRAAIGRHWCVGYSNGLRASIRDVWVETSKSIGVGERGGGGQKQKTEVRHGSRCT